MSLYFFRRGEDPFEEALFRLDVTTSEEGTTSAEPTKVPIDTGENLSDFLYLGPDMFRASGKLSPVMPFASPRGVAGVTSLIQRARDTIRNGDMLTVVFAFEVAQVALTKITRTLTHAEGFAPVIALEWIQITEITPETVRLPASRFRRPVRRQAAPKLSGPDLEGPKIEVPPGNVGVESDGKDHTEYSVSKGFRYTTTAAPLPP